MSVSGKPSNTPLSAAEQALGDDRSPLHTGSDSRRPVIWREVTAHRDEWLQLTASRVIVGILTPSGSALAATECQTVEPHTCFRTTIDSKGGAPWPST